MDINLHTDYLQYGQGNDILRFIINNGMVNISDVQNSMEAMKREEWDIIYHRNRKSDQRKEEILSELTEFKNAKLKF